MVYGDFKDLNRRIFPDKVLRDIELNIGKDPKNGRYLGALASVKILLIKC